MQKVLLVSPTWFAALAFLGCTGTGGASELEIRHTHPQVTDSSFQCTGTWPSDLTPCAYTWPSQPFTSFSSPDPGTVVLSLGRSPLPVDGGESQVSIELTIGADGQVVSATAKESTSSSPAGQITESSNATGGWVDPDVVVAGTVHGRNAGAFSLTFPFGTISGTYQTLAVP
jgi:hypothetical protein